MSSQPSPERDRHRVLLLVLVLLVVVQPVWSRMVNEIWDALSAAPTAPDGPPAPATPTAPDAQPPTTALDPVARPAEPPESPVTVPAPVITQPRAVPTEPEPDPQPSVPRPPEVLGASSRGDEIRVLVDLRDAVGPEAAIDEICIQAQAFVADSLTGRSVRLLAERGDEPLADLGRFRCR